MAILKHPTITIDIGIKARCVNPLSQPRERAVIITGTDVYSDDFEIEFNPLKAKLLVDFLTEVYELKPKTKG